VGESGIAGIEGGRGGTEQVGSPRAGFDSEEPETLANVTALNPGLMPALASQMATAAHLRQEFFLRHLAIFPLAIQPTLHQMTGRTRSIE